jgi:hypothetical protein
MVRRLLLLLLLIVCIAVHSFRLVVLQQHISAFGTLLASFFCPTVVVVVRSLPSRDDGSQHSRGIPVSVLLAVPALLSAVVFPSSGHVLFAMLLGLSSVGAAP